MFARVRPLLLSMGSYGVMYTASDLCQQKIISKNSEVDFSKTLKIGSVGCVAIAPLVFSWIRVAEFLFPGRALSMVLKKVVAEQIMFAPVVITTFYSVSSYLEGKKDIFAEAKAKFLPTYKTGLAFWPIVQTINFTFIPTSKKIYLMAAASFVWSNYLCYMKEKNATSVLQCQTARPLQHGRDYYVQ